MCDCGRQATTAGALGLQRMRRSGSSLRKRTPATVGYTGAAAPSLRLMRYPRRVAMAPMNAAAKELAALPDYTLRKIFLRYRKPARRKTRPRPTTVTNTPPAPAATCVFIHCATLPPTSRAAMALKLNTAVAR